MNKAVGYVYFNCQFESSSYFHKKYAYMNPAKNKLFPYIKLLMYKEYSS